MSDKDFYPLTAQVIKGLNDKLYEKRKSAAMDVEKLVKDLAARNDIGLIQKLIEVLRQEFALSVNPNSRKGGLIGLAGAALALGRDCEIYLSSLVPPVLGCFFDQDSRVRYYACESLYNIAKVARASVLAFFNEIFDALSKLSADPDLNVKNGADLLDRLVKDIVTEVPTVDVVSFVPLLRERLFTQNTNAKQFIVSWISVLHSVPDVNVLMYLSDLLDGLFYIFKDKSPEIRRMCEVLLGDLLKDIRKNHTTVSFCSMVNILVVHSQSDDELIQFTAITWLKEFIALSGRTMLPYYANILQAALPCVSYEQDKQHIRECSKTLILNLMRLISTEDDWDPPSTADELCRDPARSTQQQILWERLVDVLNKQLANKLIPTRMVVLRWVLHLHTKTPNKLFLNLDVLFDTLLKTLLDPADEVVLLDLEVLAELSSSSAPVLTGQEDSTKPLFGSATSIHRHLNVYFNKFMHGLLALFASNPQLLEDRGSFIIRQLCVLLNSQDVFCTLAEILQAEDDLNFVSVMVINLNTILLTSSELFELRNKLRDITLEGSWDLFCCLYRSWSHNPVAAISLCLLTQMYEHSSLLVLDFGNLEMTVELLSQIDKLIQLLESPIFTFLRLKLLEPGFNSHLLKTLYGLLMLLPQSSAFLTLQRRLDCVPRLPPSYQHTPSIRAPSNVPCEAENRTHDRRADDFEQLLDHFRRVQLSHAQFARLQLRRRPLPTDPAASSGSSSVASDKVQAGTVS